MPQPNARRGIINLCGNVRANARRRASHKALRHVSNHVSNHVSHQVSRQVSRQAVRHAFIDAHWAARCTIALLAIVPCITLSAQDTPRYDGLGLFTSGNGSRCGSAVHLSARSQWRGASVSLLPAPLSSATGYSAGTPVATFGFSSAAHRSWQLEAAGAVGHAEGDCAALSEWPRAWVQLSHAVANGGVALGLGGRSLSSLDPARDRQGLTISVWQRLRGARVSFDVRAHDAASSVVDMNPDSVFGRLPQSGSDSALWGYLRLTDTVTSRTQHRSVDLRTRLTFSLWRVAFDLTGGGTIGRAMSSGVSNSLSDSALSGTHADNPARPIDPMRVQLWGRADAHMPLASFVEVAVGVAALPAQPILGAPPRRVLSIGLGISRWPERSASHVATATAPAIFESDRADSTHVRFRFRAPSATQVLLSGEPTQWQPVVMTRFNAEWWEATVQVAPGTYRVNISVDGAQWQAPPGVPTVRDEFGGEVGIVTVR